MSVDCQGLLLGKISAEEIANVIKQKLGCDIVIDKSLHGDEEGKSIYKHEDGTEYYTIFNRINFEYNGENRSLVYYYDSTQHDIQQHKNSVDITKEYTQISLGHWGHDKEIIEAIVTEFGGYIDYSDCDDEDYVLIAQDKDNSIKPVIHITIQDIYDKFGKIVIIDK